jgi:hypothetical protein
LTRKAGPIPDFTVKFALPNGDMHPDWYRWFRDFYASLTEAIDVIDTPVPAPVVEMLEQWPYGVARPADGDYVIIQNNDVERTISATVSDADSGTCTATFKINSTPLGGTANSVSSTEDVEAHASANVLGIGDDLIVTISANADCRMMRLNTKTTRTITAT